MTGWRTFELVDDGGRPLTINAVSSMHRQAWATHTRNARERWCLRALAAKVPRLDAVEVEFTPLHRTNGSPQDVAACAPEAKAAVDGLVDAGVIADDVADIVRRVSFLPPERGCGTDGLRLTIREVMS